MDGQAGQRSASKLWVALMGMLLSTSSALAQPKESSTPIGGITFDPPRDAVIRLKSRQTIRGRLIGISAELVHLQLRNGRQFQYEFNNVVRVQTLDKEFSYSSATDTYRELKERAATLTDVSIEDTVPTVGGTPVPPAPRPGPPPMPRTVDPPKVVRLDEQPEETEVAAAVPSVVPQIPGPTASVPPTSPAPVQPFFETDGFKIGFLAACIVVIVVWWRNRVG